MADHDKDIVRTVRISTEVDEQGLKQASSTLNAFYQKYQDRTMKLDTREFNIALESVKKIQGILASTKKNSPHMTGVIDIMGKDLDAAVEHFKDTMAFFTDGSTAKGLNDILGKTSEGYSVRIADLGQRMSTLKANVEGLVSELKGIGAMREGFKGKNYFNVDDLNTSNLEQALVKMRSLMQMQQELDSFNGSALPRDQFLSNKNTDELGQYIDRLESDLSELKRLNLETIDELDRRKSIINGVGNRSTGYDSYDIDALVENAQKEKEAHQRALKDLEEYVQGRRDILGRLQENSHLFSTQELSDYSRQIDEDLATGQAQLSRLQSISFPDGGNGDAVVKDYSDLLRILGEIKDAIKPITDAFANGETALGKMAQEGSASLETLLGKLKELYDLMGKINDKPMAVTNVFNQKATTQMANKAQLDIYKEQATALLDIVDKLLLAQNKLSNSDSASWLTAFKATGMDLATFFNDFGSFDASALTGKIAGADTVSKIKTIVGTLDAYKNKLVELTQQINILTPGSVDLSILSQLDEFESRLTTATQQSGATAQSTIRSGIDETEVAQINTLRDAIDAVSKAIGRKNAGFIKEGEIVGQVTTKEISDIGNLINVINTGVLGALDALKPKLMQAFVLPPVDQSNLQASFDLIYNKFVELKDKIGEIQFNVNVDDTQSIVDTPAFKKHFEQITDFDQAFSAAEDIYGNQTGEYWNKINGSWFNSYQEALDEFKTHLEGMFRNYDGDIFTKEEALTKFQYKYPTGVATSSSDWAKVIIEAINTQGGNIVNAIKLILPKSDIAKPDETKLIDAFQTLSRAISEFSTKTLESPKVFFDHVLQGGLIDQNTISSLKALGMMSADGNPTFTLADSGCRNLGVAIADSIVLPTRSKTYDLTAELIPKLDQANELGASVPRIISSFNDGMRIFELQTRMPGKNIARDSAGELLGATDAQIDQLLHTFDVMSKVGLYFEHVGDNVLFDKEKGFSIVDLDPRQTFHTSSSDPQDMVQGFLGNIGRLFNLSRDERNAFKDRVKARAALPPEQRLVNADTVAAERESTQFETKNGIKLTPTMDKGAVAEVVKQNVEETPATVKITPVVDSATDTQKAVDGEVQSATDAAKQFVDAAKAKQKFVEANKQVAESADESTAKVTKEAEAAQQAAEEISKASSGDMGAIKKRSLITIGEDDFPSTRITDRRNDKGHNVVKTKITERVSTDDDGNPIPGAWDLAHTIETVENLADKINDVRQKLINELAKFDNQTLGFGKNTPLYQSLQQYLTIPDGDWTGDTIQKVKDGISQLDTFYNQLTKFSRQGKKSLNPFVNAVTDAPKIQDEFEAIKKQFNLLQHPSDELTQKLNILQRVVAGLTKSFANIGKTPNGLVNFTKWSGLYTRRKNDIANPLKDELSARKQDVTRYMQLIKMRNDYAQKFTKEEPDSSLRDYYRTKTIEVQQKINAMSQTLNLTEEEQNKLAAEQLNLQNRIAETIKRRKSAEADKANFISQGQKIDDMRAAGYLSQDKYKEWETQLGNFRATKDSLSPDQLKKSTEALTQLYNQYVKLGQASKNFFNKGGVLDRESWFSPDQMTNISGSLDTLYKQIAGGEQFAGFQTKVTSVNDTMGKLTFTADDCQGHITAYTLSVDTATGATSLLAGQTKAVLTPLQRLGQVLKRDFTGLLHAFIGGTGIYKFAQIIRNGIASVRDLDLALTELKKVTDGTEETYEKFLDTASKTAAKVGSTIKDFTSSTADWARLGSVSAKLITAPLYSNI